MAGDNLLMGLPPAIRSRARQFVKQYEDKISALKQDNVNLLKRITRLENEARWHLPDLQRAHKRADKFEMSHHYLAYLSDYGHISSSAPSIKEWEDGLDRVDEDDDGDEYEAPERGFNDA